MELCGICVIYMCIHCPASPEPCHRGSGRCICLDNKKFNDHCIVMHYIVTFNDSLCQHTRNNEHTRKHVLRKIEDEEEISLETCRIDV